MHSNATQKNWPEERYSIDTTIQNYKIPTIVNANEKYSIITTGLLELLDLKKCYIKFQRKFIVMSGENVNSLGKIQNLKVSLKDVPIKLSLYIIEDDYPCLVFGRNWFKQYQAQYNITRTKLRFCYQNQDIYIPITKLENELKDEVLSFGDKEEELLIDLNTEDDHTNVNEGFLIDLSEDSGISQQKDNEPSISSDLFELDIERFQQSFDQKPLEDEDFSPTTHNFNDKTFNFSSLISETFEQTSRKSVQPCSNKVTLLEQNQILMLSSPYSKRKLKDSSIRKSDKSLVKDDFTLTSQKIKPKQQLLQCDKVLEGFILQRFQAKVKKKRCFLCDQPSHVMNECLLLPEFRKHETYCKEVSIHVWKSWEKVKAQYYNTAKANNKRKIQKSKEKRPYYIHNFVPDELCRLRNMEKDIYAHNKNLF